MSVHGEESQRNFTEWWDQLRVSAHTRCGRKSKLMRREIFHFPNFILRNRSLNFNLINCNNVALDCLIKSAAAEREILWEICFEISSQCDFVIFHNFSYCPCLRWGGRSWKENKFLNCFAWAMEQGMKRNKTKKTINFPTNGMEDFPIIISGAPNTPAGLGEEKLIVWMCQISKHST